ncbi:MAG: FIST N-terminal domain-containing protein, partial [Nitrospirales bacterium]
MQAGIRTALRFSAVVSRDTNAVQAGRDLGQATRRALGERPADLAFLFFSPHYAEQSTDLTAAVRRELAPNLLVGCTGEGIIGGTEEIESAPAISLWAARLPG